MTTLPQHLRTISDRLLAHAELHDVVLGQTGDDEQRQLAADLREAAALLTDAPREQRAQVEIERLRRALHEVAEEWVGAECGEPVHAQEAYAIALAQRMYRLAAEALAAGREADTGTTHADGCWNWGARHYECALREIERMQAELNDWRRLAARPCCTQTSCADCRRCSRASSCCTWRAPTICWQPSASDARRSVTRSRIRPGRGGAWTRTRRTRDAAPAPPSAQGKSGDSDDAMCTLRQLCR